MTSPVITYFVTYPKKLTDAQITEIKKRWDKHWYLILEKGMKIKELNGDHLGWWSTTIAGTTMFIYKCPVYNRHDIVPELWEMEAEEKTASAAFSRLQESISQLIEKALRRIFFGR